MTIRRVHKDTRSSEQVRQDAEIARLAERGELVDPKIRRRALAAGAVRREDRIAARKRIKEIEPIKLDFVLERRGPDDVAYLTVLPRISVSAKSKDKAHRLLFEALNAFVASDPVAFVEAVDVDDREGGSFTYRAS